MTNNFNFFTSDILKIELLYPILKTLLIILLICIHSTVHSEIHINITTGTKKLRPIAVVPFHDHNININNVEIRSNINKISDIIAFDLCHSGKFYIFPSLQFPEQITHISNISTKEWINLGINILVIGSITETNNNEYLIFYQLIDISNNSAIIILQNQYTVSLQWIRYAGHSISNDIFEKLTGIQGAFCTRIAYITHNPKNEQYPYKLYVADYDGYNEVLIHRSKEPLMSPTWSPSGNELVYVTFENYHSMIVIHDLKRGIIHQLISFPRHNGAPSFSPDGRKLAFVLSKTGSLNLYVMDLFSKKIEQITNERSNNTEPSWFPDSITLAYTSDRSGTPQIYKINTKNINHFSQRLSWSNTHNQNGRISSNGKFLIMISKNNRNQNITKLDLLTGEYHQLTNSILDESLTLAPNGSMLIYNTFDELQQSKLYLLSIDGHYKVCLKIDHKNIRFPAWSSYIDQPCNKKY